MSTESRKPAAAPRSAVRHLALQDEAATLRLGITLARHLRAGDALFLAGDLGAGKTALARALIQALCPGEEVPSPTFTLVQTYTGPDFDIVHYDLYRVESPDELWELEWAEAESRLALVEWPDRLGALSPPADRLEISLGLGLGPEASPEERRARLEGFGRWRDELGALERELTGVTTNEGTKSRGS